MSNDNKFNVGDVVVLKSGGLRMTVEDPEIMDIRGSVECVWFVEEKLDRAWFDPRSLVLAESKDKE